MKKLKFASWIVVASWIGCFPVSADQALTGVWLKDTSQQVIPDPQFSGLTWRHDELLMLADQSAMPEMRMKLFRFNPASGQLNAPSLPITLSKQVREGCFGDYLANSPDLEALTWDRVDDTTLITVTEDASRAQLSPTCARKFEQTNSTKYPTLLLRITVDKALSKAEITAVRPVQFPLEAQVGDQPNDGIEGLAIDNLQNLYLSLEKDLSGKPALFKTRLTADFWAKDNFVKVINANLTLPKLDDRPHPINDLEFLPSPVTGHPGYLVAVARNDDQLWIFDLTNRVAPFVHPLSFYVKTDTSGLCPLYERMVQTALEGVTVHDNTMYLVNDPWKQHYGENIQCDVNAEHFRTNSSLLFKTEFDPRWFTLHRQQGQTGLPALSGLAKIDDKHYLAVQDKKISTGGDRLAVIELSQTGSPKFTPIAVENWPNRQAANDLEAICALPGRNNEFLLSESGTWQDEFGRLFHIKLEQNYAVVLRSFDLPVVNDANPQQTGDQFEGLACQSLSPNRYQLVLAERGDQHRAGSLQLGVLDLAANDLQWQPQRVAIVSPVATKTEHQRDLADLYLDGNQLWGVAVRDVGEQGPFQSLIYKVATLDQTAPQQLFINPFPKVAAQIDGFKVEALAAPSSLTPGTLFMIGTDDENFGGVIRPIEAQHAAQ